MNPKTSFKEPKHYPKDIVWFVDNNLIISTTIKDTRAYSNGNVLYTLDNYTSEEYNYVQLFRDFKSAVRFYKKKTSRH